MAIKAAQYSGNLTSSDISEALYYAIQNGADVINMSFAQRVRSPVVEDALSVHSGMPYWLLLQETMISLLILDYVKLKEDSETIGPTIFFILQHIIGY